MLFLFCSFVLSGLCVWCLVVGVVLVVGLWALVFVICYWLFAFVVEVRWSAFGSWFLVCVLLFLSFECWVLVFGRCLWCLVSGCWLLVALCC